MTITTGSHPKALFGGKVAKKPPPVKGRMKKKPVTKNSGRLLSDAERKVPKANDKWSHQSSGGTGSNGGM